MSSNALVVTRDMWQQSDSQSFGSVSYAVRFRDKAREKQRQAVLKQRAKDWQAATEQAQSQPRQRQAPQVRRKCFSPDCLQLALFQTASAAAGQSAV